jgi:hypothetical protein
MFSPNLTSGITPIYNLLSQVTSGIYPQLANFTFGILKPLAGLLNTVSSNLYHGLCAPPVPATTAPGGGFLGGLIPTSGPTSASSTGGSITGSPSTGGATDPITNIINSLTGSGSGATSAPSTGVLGSPTATSAPSTGVLGSPTATSAPSTGVLGSPTATNSPSTGTLGSVPAILPLPLSVQVIASLTITAQELATLLGKIGQTIDSLANALNTIPKTAQQFIDGFIAAKAGGETALLAYLQSIFTQAATATPATSTNSLAVLLDNLLAGLSGILGGTGLVPTLDSLLQGVVKLLGGK